MQKGFSLVELMVVIAIIAILATVAIPMYSNYTVRSKIGSELAKVGGAKTDIAEQISNKGITTLGAITGQSFASPSSTPDNAAVNTATGAITVNVGNTNFNSAPRLATPIVTDEGAITLTPSLTSGAIIWACANASGSKLTSSQLPSNCTANS